MSDEADKELNEVVKEIDVCQDVVDLLAVLLRICRRHSEAVMDAYQDWEKRDQLRTQRALLQEEATKAFTTDVLIEAMKEFARKTLREGTDLAVTARALALGIDDSVQSRDPTAYGQLCRKWPIRDVLKDGDPYPTPSVNLSAMYGGKHGLSSRPDTNAGTAFDRVEGLALWGSSRLKVIYDTVAGTCLDDALRETVDIDILGVSPNGKMWGEFWFDDLTEYSFFRARILNPTLQDDIVKAALQTANELAADIVVTPELSSTPDTVGLVKRSTVDGRPPIVIAGGSHVTINGERLNRLSTIYTGPKPVEVTHDKIGAYKFCFKGDKKRYELDEAIDRSRTLRIHAGVNWSMIPLICADFLEPGVVDAVADLCPRLVMVASMSRKTGNYVKSMGQVIRQSQALVVVVNGPHDWGDAEPPVAVIGMPLEDSKEWITELSPEPSDKPPYLIVFSSRLRAAKFI